MRRRTFPTWRRSAVAWTVCRWRQEPGHCAAATTSRQRHTVQATADRRHVGKVLRRMPELAHALQQQGDRWDLPEPSRLTVELGRRHFEWSDRNLVLPRNTQRRAAGSDDRQTGTIAHELGDQRRHRQQLLEVVEHQQQVEPTEAVLEGGQRLRRGRSRVDLAAAMAASAIDGSRMGARSTNRAPFGEGGRLGPGQLQRQRVLPMPPRPVRVIRRAFPAPSRSCKWASSRSRPISRPADAGSAPPDSINRFTFSAGGFRTFRAQCNAVSSELYSACGC